MRLLLIRSGLLLLATFAPVAPAADLTPADLYQRTLHATAWIITPTKGKGTGWVIDRGRRWLITNFHVVADHETVDVLFPTRRDGRVITDRTYYIQNLRELRRSGRAVSGRVLRKDPARDLALVELDSLPDDAAALKLAPDRPQPGNEVHAVGNRRDLDELWGYTSGHVRQVCRTDEGYFWHGRQLARGAGIVLAEVPINEGDSGGPVVNARGDVVGVMSAVRWQASLASLCIAADEVRAFVDAKPPATPDKPADAACGAEVYRKALRSAALVKTASSNDRGTAWVLDGKRGLLVTSATSVAAQDFVEVVFPVKKDGRTVAEAIYYRDHRRELRASGHTLRGRVLARDPARNLALLEVDTLPEGTADLPLADTVLEPGARLHALGNPNSVEALWMYAAGNVRQLGRLKIDPAEDAKAVRVVVAQLPLSDGDSGGPVLDDRGRLVGVVAGKDAPQQLVGYLLDVREVQTFVDATRSLRAPRGATEFLGRAALYARLRLWQRAGADYDAALAIDGKNPAALAGRAHVWLHKGDADRALADCEAALAIDGKCVAALVERAAVRSRKGDHVGALADGDAAVKLAPKNAFAFAARGDARRLKGDRDGAMTDLDEAIWLDPNLAPAYHARGLVWARRGDHDKAARDLAHAAALDPNDPSLWRALAESLHRKGDDAGAKRAEERARQAAEDTASPRK